MSWNDRCCLQLSSTRGMSPGQSQAIGEVEAKDRLLNVLLHTFKPQSQRWSTRYLLRRRPVLVNHTVKYNGMVNTLDRVNSTFRQSYGCNLVSSSRERLRAVVLFPSLLSLFDVHLYRWFLWKVWRKMPDARRAQLQLVVLVRILATILLVWRKGER